MRQFEEPKKNGFSLLEAIAVLGVFGILAAFMLPAISNMSQKSSHYADQKANIDSLVGLLSERLKYDSSCNTSMSVGVTTVISDADFTAKVQQAFDPAIANGGLEIILNIPGIQSGAAMTGNILSSTTPDNLLPARRLKVDHLRLSDGLKYVDTAGTLHVVASVYLSVSDISGNFSYLPIFIGTVRMQLDGAKKVVACASSDSIATKDVCQDMGCVYNSASVPPCQCRQAKTLCGGPGKYLVALKNGQPDCLPLGGADCQGSDVYLVGVAIGKNICSPAPTATLPPPVPPAPPVVNGQCGGANGGTYANAGAVAAAGLCSQGTSSALTGTGPWTWQCQGSGTGHTDASCGANTASAGTCECTDISYDSATCASAAQPAVIMPGVVSAADCATNEVADTGCSPGFGGNSYRTCTWTP